MLRFLFRRPRTVRVPIDKSNVEVQQVNVSRQSNPVVGRFILTCIVTTAAIQGIKRWDPLGTHASRDVLQEGLENVKKNAQHEHGDKYGKHWDKQHSQMRGAPNTAMFPPGSRTDAIRITVPIWLRKGHQRMYTENDAEWKEFAKLQGDPKRIEHIKRQIGEVVMAQIRDHGRNKFELALVQFTGRVGVALEVVPQVFTPPIYEVPCFWLSPSSFSFGWRPLPPQTGARMERVFRPVVLLDASMAAAYTFFMMTYAVTKARIMEKLGWDNTGGVRSTIVLPQMPSDTKAGVDDASSESSKSTKPNFPYFPDLANGDTMRKMHSDVVSSMPYSSAIQHAAYAFNHVRNARQKLAVSTNVRGVCQIRGYITFFGERGRFRLEVVAYYLPADNVFLGAINVKSGYVVQDYRAWEKLNDRERVQKQRKEKQVENGQSSDSKSSEPPSASASREDEKDKG